MPSVVMQAQADDAKRLLRERIASRARLRRERKEPHVLPLLRRALQFDPAHALLDYLPGAAEKRKLRALALALRILQVVDPAGAPRHINIAVPQAARLADAPGRVVGELGHDHHVGRRARVLILLSEERN